MAAAAAVCLLVALDMAAPIGALQPLVGAIRWDAYFGQPGMEEFDDVNAGIVSRTTTYDLSPKRWHYRVPFFGREINDSAVIINGDTPAVMGQELQYAADHGIQFWSFCNYPIGCREMHPPDSECARIQCCADNVRLSYAWEQYLAHPDNHKVNFTLLLQPGYWFPTSLKGGNETLEQEIARYISYFKMPNYQKVLGGRPLVFLFGAAANRTDLQVLRDSTQEAIGVQPYITSMNQQAIPEVDAVSRYVTTGGTPSGAPFQKAIADKEAAQWDSWAASGKKVIATVSAGWDSRPRKSYPCNFSSSTNCSCPWGGAGSAAYTIDPTMEELTAHTKAGLEWVKAHNTGKNAAAEANAMLLRCADSRLCQRFFSCTKISRGTIARGMSMMKAIGSPPPWRSMAGHRS